MSVTLTLNYGGDDPQKTIPSEKVHFTNINTILTVLNGQFTCFFLVSCEHLSFREKKNPLKTVDTYFYFIISKLNVLITIQPSLDNE